MKTLWHATRRYAMPAAVLAATALACSKPLAPPPSCDAREVAPDAASSVPRPETSKASFEFHGNNLEQREFVFMHEDGSYDYVERWDLGVPREGQLQKTMGWDWKVGCRMHRCPLSDGKVCCYQTCEDGGASGVGYEAPDRFDCMNKAAGGRYHWFVQGLYDSGMKELAACLDASGTRGRRHAPPDRHAARDDGMQGGEINPFFRPATAPPAGECPAEASRARDGASSRG